MRGESLTYRQARSSLVVYDREKKYANAGRDGLAPKVGPAATEPLAVRAG